MFNLSVKIFYLQTIIWSCMVHSSAGTSYGQSDRELATTFDEQFEQTAEVSDANCLSLFVCSCEICLN